jgi:hypothetical protein
VRKKREEVAGREAIEAVTQAGKIIVIFALLLKA